MDYHDIPRERQTKERELVHGCNYGLLGKESIGWQDGRVTGSQCCLEEDPNDPLMILILL